MYGSHTICAENFIEEGKHHFEYPLQSSTAHTSLCDLALYNVYLRKFSFTVVCLNLVTTKDNSFFEVSTLGEIRFGTREHMHLTKVDYHSSFILPTFVYFSVYYSTIILYL
jgi:hypothetical protein